MRRDREDTNCWKINRYFYFICVQNVFSSHHKIPIEPLMADGLSWRCFSYFSVPWQWELLSSQWDSHKPPGFHLKYLNLFFEDEQRFFLQAILDVYDFLLSDEYNRRYIKKYPGSSKLYIWLIKASWSELMLFVRKISIFKSLWTVISSFC